MENIEGLRETTCNVKIKIKIDSNIHLLRNLKHKDIAKSKKSY